MSEINLQHFWMSLHSELQKIEIPLRMRTDRSADVGWGKGYRILIDSLDRISHPAGKFVPLSDVVPLEYASDIAKAYRLTRREKEILNALRDGHYARCSTRRKMAHVGSQRVGICIIDRLSLLGLAEERPCGNSSDYEVFAVQPISVNK